MSRRGAGRLAGKCSTAIIGMKIERLLFKQVSFICVTIDRYLIVDIVCFLSTTCLVVPNQFLSDGISCRWVWLGWTQAIQNTPYRAIVFCRVVCWKLVDGVIRLCNFNARKLHAVHCWIIEFRSQMTAEVWWNVTIVTMEWTSSCLLRKRNKMTFVLTIH